MAIIVHPTKKINKHGNSPAMPGEWEAASS